jgi:circadian clock protein KaiB
MRRICAEHISERYTLEIIDIYLHPEACQKEQIIAVPTLLLKVSPILCAASSVISPIRRKC